MVRVHWWLNHRSSKAIRDAISNNQSQSETIQRPREAISCNQLQSVAIRGNQGQSVVKQRLGRVNHKSNHMQSVPIRANQCQFETIQRPSERQSVAIRCNQGPSVVNNSALAGSIIVSNQMQSVPIRAHQSPSETMKRARASSLAAFDDASCDFLSTMKALRGAV